MDHGYDARTDTFEVGRWCMGEGDTYRVRW